MKTLATILVFSAICGLFLEAKRVPFVINTWGFTNATLKAWDVINRQSKSAITAVVEGCTVCEIEQCDTSVGYGGSPNEEGETTLDAMIMDGKTMKVGAVGGLRHIKSAMSVAWHVLHYTKHTLLVGDQATEFATKMGFEKESLTTDFSEKVTTDWKEKNCQPNYWMNVMQNTESCGPYDKLEPIEGQQIKVEMMDLGDHNHDTIGMIAIDKKGDIAAGTSTNGLTYKIPGRVGDSPIPGSGAYADNKVGGAAATGDGDIMMRFSPTFLAVELLRNGQTPQQAADRVINRIAQYYPNNSAAIVVTDMDGNYGAACQIFSSFPISIYYPELDEVKVEVTRCRRADEEVPTIPGAGSRVIVDKVLLICLIFVIFNKI
ncbi:N(4)-(Beta-N-acetylglucosaminyl)-L-asparaginase-like [Chironomus tepperi]|uniref:N(4)-(Beta-N-acetylglucosaminyl)-L-asparaginase- like n=1 Tax=Chironomus tepperi TaxID=113505 RepID=UPI00391F72F7